MTRSSLGLLLAASAVALSAAAPANAATTCADLAQLKIAAKDMDHWATVSAQGSNPMTQEEAARINARANGWAFKLTDMGVTQFTASLETLLKPLPRPARPFTAFCTVKMTACWW